MPSESAKAALRDIAHHIDLAVEFAALAETPTLSRRTCAQFMR
jgi:hypothetical protein